MRKRGWGPVSDEAETVGGPQEAAGTTGSQVENKTSLGFI